MAEVIKRNKALSVSPLKSSQTVGAALAFLGIERAMPMLHGSQGCTAFGKVFFVRHFREPIPLQTTAIDQVSAVMGPDDNVVEGLKTLCEKSNPAIIGVPTTGVVETEGTDVRMAVRDFQKKHPEHASTAVVPVITPDFSGCLETGFALAVKEMIDALVPTTPAKGAKRRKQVNILVSSTLTPGDIEEVKELVERFGLRPVVLPDIADSLDGHLIDMEFTPLTMGGTPVDEIRTLGKAKATLVIGGSLTAAADLLKERTGVPDYRFDHLMGLAATDAFIAALADISDQPVPDRIERQRSQLQDAMLDTHFMTGLSKIAIAADPELLAGYTALVQETGARVTAAISPTNSPLFRALDVDQVKIGDLEELEKRIQENGADLIIANSHAAATADRLGMPLLRAGFPQYDLVGGYARCWIGYRGARQALFDLANMMLALGHGEVAPHRSIYAQPDNPRGMDHDHDATLGGLGRQHG
ncbi:MAG: nitrogenase iron-molybdenum cofactor biosynthesis protein NifN [Magnetospiraceae bacterium]